MALDMLYNGQQIDWFGHGTFKATSGMPGYQQPSFQCEKERGPVPEGNYYIPLIEGGVAKDDGTGVCRLKPSWQIEKILRGVAAGVCEPYWANWGNNRVRFEPADITTKQKCHIVRSGFYLHDSTKGYSHGCIEVQLGFFSELRIYLKRNPAKTQLALKIKYIPGRSTNGGTQAP
jgi:hypothetical protein